MRSSVDRADITRQIGVGGRPSRSWSAPPSCNSPRPETSRTRAMVRMGYMALVRAHEPVNPFRARLALPREPGCRLCQDVALLTQAMVLTSRRSAQFLPLSACRPINALAGVLPLHPTGNRLGGRLELTRQLLGACVQIAPDRPSVAGTPADKRFGSGASDTSKINFKGVHQTGSTPGRLRSIALRVTSTSAADRACQSALARKAGPNRCVRKPAFHPEI